MPFKEVAPSNGALKRMLTAPRLIRGFSLPTEWPYPIIPWLLCGLLALFLLYLLGLYFYTRELLEALCERRDDVCLKLLDSALDCRAATFVFAPVQFLLDLLSDRNLDTLHPERAVRRAQVWAQELRDTGDEGPGYTSPLRKHGEVVEPTPAGAEALRLRQHERWS